jgi:hypothetical protein
MYPYSSVVSNIQDKYIRVLYATDYTGVRIHLSSTVPDYTGVLIHLSCPVYDCTEVRTDLSCSVPDKCIRTTCSHEQDKTNVSVLQCSQEQNKKNVSVLQLEYGSICLVCY